jgi:hypothetical protein
MLEKLLFSRYDLDVVVDEPGNRVIVSASKALLQQVDALIETLDSRPRNTPKNTQMMYRVYMLEPPIEQDMQAFSLTVACNEFCSAMGAKISAQEYGLQIDSVRQRGPENGIWEDQIQGRTPSKEAVWEFAECYRHGDVQIRELVWEEDEAFIAGVPAAQITALSAPLQAHIRSLLGEKIQTVGYWFGSLSLPGEAMVPIGLWLLTLEIETSGADELECRIEVNQERTDGEFMQVIGNRIQAKIGKPIIIGYNRDRCGTRTMGALVIVAEEDKTPVSK